MATPDLLDPVAHDVRSRVFGLVFWVLLPLFAIWMIHHGLHEYSEQSHRRADGMTGTFVVTNRSCFGNVCQTAGTFTSDDGSFRESNLLGDYRWQVGQKHTAVYKQDTGIIALPAKWNPTASLMGAAGGVLFLVMWLYFLFAGLWTRRRPPGPSVA